MWWWCRNAVCSEVFLNDPAAGLRPTQEAKQSHSIRYLRFDFDVDFVRVECARGGLVRRIDIL